MGERYSQMDLNLYGAEDDFEMDSILRAVDRVLDADVTNGELLRARESGAVVVCPDVRRSVVESGGAS